MNTVDKCIDYFPKGKALIARRSGEIGGVEMNLSFGGVYNAVVEVVQDEEVDDPVHSRMGQWG
jgi:hypothetical protein